MNTPVFSWIQMITIVLAVINLGQVSVSMLVIKAHHERLTRKQAWGGRVIAALMLAAILIGGDIRHHLASMALIFISALAVLAAVSSAPRHIARRRVAERTGPL